MSPQRAALAALVLVGSSLASRASAQVGPRTVVVYPLSAGGSGDARDVESLLDAALHRAVQRSGELVLAQPLVARASCGPAASATPQCLAGLAGAGLVLRVGVHRSQSTLVVLLEAIDARARVIGPVTVSVDAYAQSSGPLTHGVLMLIEQAAAAARPRADLRPSEPPLPPPPRAALPAPVQLAEQAAPAQPRAWMRTAGPWLTGAGLALLGGGVAVSVMNRSLSDELDRKHAAGTLGAGDLASYERVEEYNQLTQLLLASGGVFTVAGAAIWTAAPERGRVVAGVAGRF